MKRLHRAMAPMCSKMNHLYRCAAVAPVHRLMMAAALAWHLLCPPSLQLYYSWPNYVGYYHLLLAAPMAQAFQVDKAANAQKQINYFNADKLYNC